MKTINSLSGGKTSSYMAVHHPADVNIFSLVRIEDPSCSPKDEGLIKLVSDKIGMDFIATAESDKTLKVLFDLEQMMGREIVWITGDTFEQVIKKQGGILPNMMLRFCTQKMKMKPIFDYCYNNFGKVMMNIGFRYDEIERSARQNNIFRTVVGKLPSGRNRWGDIEWRECSYPLIESKVTHYDVKKWSDSTQLVFPPDSNCVGCFHKPVQQLRKNFEDEPEKMQWFADQEVLTKNGKKKLQWKKEMSYDKIKKIGLQTDFFFGTGTGCQAGFCTD
jgi:hypothetical protein